MKKVEVGSLINLTAEEGIQPQRNEVVSLLRPQFSRHAQGWPRRCAAEFAGLWPHLCMLVIFWATGPVCAAARWTETPTLPGRLIVASDAAFSSTTPNLADLPRRIFESSSFWYNPIPIDVPLHQNSEAFVRDFLRQLNSYYGHVVIHTGSYSSPIYLVGNDVAAVSVAPWDCQSKGYYDQKLAEQWEAVPIPAYAQAAGGSDAEMTIYQPATDMMWEFWRARKVNGRWEACWGGRMLNVSKSDGIWPPHYGATATGLPFLGGLITADELRRGAINHVIGIALVEVESWKIFSWPANRSDGDNPTGLPDRIPEGLRFRLDPTIDVDALGVHPIAKIIAKAAQKYGFVVWDKGGAIALGVEDPKRFTTVGLPDPYPAIWKGTPANKVLTGFPWEKLQFLPMNYGRP